ncbi:MAG: hypothetical protein M5T61_15060 [Acidimicrobiia bacterium]|nr:hypothetical protein [Acidimicrobiia bacterium]
MRELLELLNDAGHTDFRDARGPMGFTQRQAAGRFTRDEADSFIERLQDRGDGSDEVVAEPVPRLSAAERSLRRLPTRQLAAELQRRGWAVMEP